ncbi:hypothetical protein Aperf_G00000128953 [Anoplocephala perfoliata]
MIETEVKESILRNKAFFHIDLLNIPSGTLQRHVCAKFAIRLSDPQPSLLVVLFNGLAATIKIEIVTSNLTVRILLSHRLQLHYGITEEASERPTSWLQGRTELRSQIRQPDVHSPLFTFIYNIQRPAFHYSLQILKTISISLLNPEALHEDVRQQFILYRPLLSKICPVLEPNASPN